uniref:peptidylprolyl isomerase n=1 Tax=Gouania willdenowi TaxID=441366 RepID=A0A8C5H6K1_GOUWI
YMITIITDTNPPGGGRDSWPELGQTVKINLKTRLLDGTLVEELSEFWFTLGHKEVIPALDAAVRLMGMGEKAVIMTDGKYANGFRGNLYPEIPSKADLSLEKIYCFTIKGIDVS